VQSIVEVLEIEEVDQTKLLRELQGLFHRALIAVSELILPKRILELSYMPTSHDDQYFPQRCEFSLGRE
jgi:hypothetical protein